MPRSRLACLFVIGLLGCHHAEAKHHTVKCTECAEACVTKANGRCARTEDCSEEVEVRAPRQKVVVEMPSPAVAYHAPASAPAPCAPAPYSASMPAGQPMPGVMPNQMPAAGQPMMASMTTQVRERTGLGFMFDTVRIPMPIIRPIAVPRPAEMTTTMPVAAAPTMMMPVTPAMMPMAAPMAMPMGMAGMGGMMPQASAGMGATMSVQGSMTAQQLAMMMAATGQMSPQQMALLMQFAGNGAMTPQQTALLLQMAGNVQMTPQQLAAFLQANAAVPPSMPSLPGASGQNALGQRVSPTLVSNPNPPAAGNPSTNLAASPAPEAGVPSAQSLQEQLQAAEQRLRQLEELRARSQK